MIKDITMSYEFPGNLCINNKHSKQILIFGYANGGLGYNVYKDDDALTNGDQPIMVGEIGENVAECEYIHQITKEVFGKQSQRLSVKIEKTLSSILPILIVGALFEAVGVPFITNAIIMFIFSFICFYVDFYRPLIIKLFHKAYVRMNK